MMPALVVLAGLCDFWANWLTAHWLIPVGGLVIPSGTLAFTVSFVAADTLRRFWGRRATVAAFALGFLASMAYAALFGGAIGRIALAGLAALLCSSTTDYVVQGRAIRLPIWQYVGISNAVSLAIDTAVFSLIAFAGNPALGSILLGQYLAKLAMTAVSVPAVYGVRRLAPAPAPALAVGAR